MLKFALQYESVAQFVKEFPEKIATTGVYVKSEKPVEVGDAIGLLFRFKSQPDSFTGTGEVVWIDTDEEAKSGKKGLVIRNIKLDAESQRVFNSNLKSASAETAHDDHAVQTVVMTPPAAPARATPPPAPAARAAHPAPAPAPAPKKRWPLVVGGVVAVLLIGFAVWYFALGGKAILDNLGIEYRDGRVTKVDPVGGSFAMGLVDQVSSDWLVAVTPETQWIGVRGLNELRVEDRIGMRYRESDGKYEAVQVTVKERVMAGTIGSLIDKTKGVFKLQDSKIAGSVVELSSEFNDQLRTIAGKLKPGDVVDTVYAVGKDGKNMVSNIVVRERTATGAVTAVDAAAHSISLKQDDNTDLSLTASGEVEVAGVEGGLAGVAPQDVVKVVFKPDSGQLLKLEMVTKYVPPPTPEPVKAPPPPRVMKDVIYNTDAVMARFAFVFNRRAEYGSPQNVPGAFSRVVLPVKGATSDYPKSELFLSTGPLRTVRFTNDGGNLIITFLAEKGVTPRCSFETEGEKIVALCFKN